MPEAYNSSERVLPKEILVSLLTDAVFEANQMDSNVLGVLVFGSRTHQGAAREHSDVDIIQVLKKTNAKTSCILTEAVDSKLRPLGLRVDCQSIVYISWMEIDYLRTDTKRRLSFLDRDSEFIITDGDITRKLKEFSGSESRDWWRLVIKSPQV